MSKQKREQFVFEYKTRAEADVKYNELKSCWMFYDEARPAFLVTTIFRSRNGLLIKQK
jgi:hypothetical protein